MAFMLFSIDEAVDSKYIIIKSMKGQAKKGTLIHVMDAREDSDGITVDYRITKTKQDYTANFESIKQFCKWCMPSTFLAKYYDKLSSGEVIRYIKVENRSFVNFHLPLILISLVVVWGVAMAAVMLNYLDLIWGLAIAGGLSVICVIAVFLIGHVTKNSMTERLYRKVSTSSYR